MADTSDKKAPGGGTGPTMNGSVGGVPSRGVASDDSNDSKIPRRLRRLHSAWPAREGNVSYLLTLCVENRLHVLSDETVFDRFVSFLIDSPTRYGWFGRRFVIMPDHIHAIVHQGSNAVVLGLWIKAMKAVVGGLRGGTRREGTRPAIGADGWRLTVRGLRMNWEGATWGHVAYNCE